jgi:hypothetical protein
LTNRIAVLGGVVAVAISGCGGKSDLEALRDSAQPYFYVGTSFDGLDLTAVDNPPGRLVTLIYGTCEAGDDAGCTPPLEIQNKTCATGETAVTIFADGNGRASRAAEALTPLNAAAGRAERPPITFDRSPAC